MPRPGPLRMMMTARRAAASVAPARRRRRGGWGSKSSPPSAVRSSIGGVIRCPVGRRRTRRRRRRTRRAATRSRGGRPRPIPARRVVVGGMVQVVVRCCRTGPCRPPQPPLPHPLPRQPRPLLLVPVRGAVPPSTRPDGPPRLPPPGTAPPQQLLHLLPPLLRHQRLLPPHHPRRLRQHIPPRRTGATRSRSTTRGSGPARTAGRPTPTRSTFANPAMLVGTGPSTMMQVTVGVLVVVPLPHRLPEASVPAASTLVPPPRRLLPPLPLRRLPPPRPVRTIPRRTMLHLRLLLPPPLLRLRADLSLERRRPPPLLPPLRVAVDLCLARQPPRPPLPLLPRIRRRTKSPRRRLPPLLLADLSLVLPPPLQLCLQPPLQHQPPPRLLRCRPNRTRRRTNPPLKPLRLQAGPAPSAGLRMKPPSSSV
mmetsp:Transcript_3885/g.8899  ORF Transcript_3885/g.8899 Transcript_3885/m.8899 type:complete len:423 (-) Transcript_3885:630-1898(-)